VSSLRCPSNHEFRGTSLGSPMGPVPCTEAKRFFAAVVGVQLAIWAVRRSAARCGLCHERNEHPLLSYVVAIAFLLIISDALYRRIGCASGRPSSAPSLGRRPPRASNVARLSAQRPSPIPTRAPVASFRRFPLVSPRAWASAMSDAAAVDPVLHGARLCPCREAVGQKAGILAPASACQVLTRRSDAPAHGVDLLRVVGTD
jgi:hypothetical protein